MSAQIPETMLLSDLLKPTGYDCPEDLRGKTFNEATTGGDAKISTNTAKTIDVSAYTEPVVIEPAEGYDATKKVTVTLDNIPAGTNMLYAWFSEGDLNTIYTQSTTPSVGDPVLIYIYSEYKLKKDTEFGVASYNPDTNAITRNGQVYSRTPQSDIEVW